MCYYLFILCYHHEIERGTAEGFFDFRSYKALFSLKKSYISLCRGWNRIISWICRHLYPLFASNKFLINQHLLISFAFSKSCRNEHLGLHLNWILQSTWLRFPYRALNFCWCSRTATKLGPIWNSISVLVFLMSKRVYPGCFFASLRWPGGQYWISST
jgi:hypothetical protein